MTSFSGEEKPQVVLRFLDRPEQMSLNKTNALAIARQPGNDTDGWAGKQIALRSEMVQGPSGTVPGAKNE